MKKYNENVIILITMDKIDEILTKGVTNIIPSKNGLEKLLRSKKKLNVYLGIDPTATKIHLGNAVSLRKLQAFVELGHNVTFLIGDFTALIGDTSDKESERPILSYEEIKKNFKTYRKQTSKIVDFSKVKIVKNSTWLKKLSFSDIVKLCQNFSLNDFLSRELIKKRLNQGKKIRLDEVLYPIMQGYDSYFLDTDIQIGGADQTFNMQAGRVLQKKLRNKETFILITGYLEGTDGRKMSKSWNNAIWLEDTPENIFGKIMSINDNSITDYFELATNVSLQRLEAEKNALKNGENPMSVKTRLAFEIVKELYSKKEAKKAQKYFEKTFREKMPEFKQKIKAKKTLAETISQIVGSMNKAKTLISQKAVKINTITITDPKTKIRGGEEIKIGKKTFIKVDPQNRE